MLEPEWETDLYDISEWEKAGTAYPAQGGANYTRGSQPSASSSTSAGETGPRETCVVCMNDLKMPGRQPSQSADDEEEDPEFLPCGHVIGKRCLRAMMDHDGNQTRCPQCRKNIYTEGNEETTHHSLQQTSQPSSQRTSQPSYQQTSRPSSQRTSRSRSQRTSQPSYQRTSQPSYQRTSQPSYQRNSQPRYRSTVQWSTDPAVDEVYHRSVDDTLETLRSMFGPSSGRRH